MHSSFTRTRAMSLYLSPLGESMWGVKFPMRSVVAALEDRSFNPGLTSTVEASASDEGPLSPTAGLLRARYGPYLLYLHPTQQITTMPTCMPRNVNWAVSGDLTFVAGWSGSRIAISCNLQTYTEPHTDAGDGWCGVCGRPHVLINTYAAGLTQAEHPDALTTGSSDHWYAQSGLHTSPETHSGPLVAATTIPALLRATAIAREHWADKLADASKHMQSGRTGGNSNKSPTPTPTTPAAAGAAMGVAEEEEEEEDAWVNGWKMKGDLGLPTAHVYHDIVAQDPMRLRAAEAVEVMLGARAGEEEANLTTRLNDSLGNFLFPELLDSVLEFPSEMLEIVHVAWLPVHWGGYAYHSVAIVVLRNGFVLALCPLSLRIIQLQHLLLAPEVAGNDNDNISKTSLLRRAAALALGRGRHGSTGTGASQDEVVYEVEETVVKAAQLCGDGVGGAMLSVSHKGGVWMCPVKAIVRDLQQRMILPSAAGYSVWPSINVPLHAASLLPLSNTPLPTTPQYWGSSLTPTDAAPLALAPPSSPDSDFQPVAIPVPKLLSQWLAVGTGFDRAVLSPMQRPPRSMRRAAAALVSLAASWWFSSAPAPPTLYLPPPRRCAVANTTVLHDGTRTAVQALAEPVAVSVATGKGSWPLAALHCLARLLTTRRHASELFTKARTHTRTRARAPLPLPLLPWASRLAPSRTDGIEKFSHGTLVAITDTLGRVNLFDSTSLKLVYQWGGHRSAQVCWVWPIPVASTQTSVSVADCASGDNESVTVLANKSISALTQRVHAPADIAATTTRSQYYHSSEFAPPARPLLLIHGARGVAEVWTVSPVVVKVGSINLGSGAVVPCSHTLAHMHLDTQTDVEACEAIWRAQRRELEQLQAEQREEAQARARMQIDHPLQAPASEGNQSEVNGAGGNSTELKTGSAVAEEDEFFDMEDTDPHHTVLSTLEIAGKTPLPREDLVNSESSRKKPVEKEVTLPVRTVLYSLVGALVVSEGGDVDVLMAELDLPASAGR